MDHQRDFDILLLPDDLANHRPHNPDIPIQTTGASAKEQCLRERGRKAHANTTDAGAKQSDKEYSFPADPGSIGGSTPPDSREELCGGEGCREHPALAGNRAVWEARVEEA